jgi:hypothetical protein
MIYPNKTVPTTDINDPKLEIVFQPVNASG